jgi:hypothetical protein
MLAQHTYAAVSCEVPVAMALEQLNHSVERLQAECDAITKLNHSQWLALENVRALAAKHRSEEWAQHLLRFCDSADCRAQIMRNAALPKTPSVTDQEIIKLLGGVTAVARMLGIKPPSVQGWLQTGIPEGRLIELAGQLEAKSEGRFSRKLRWPDRYMFLWPELAAAQTDQAQAATENVANEAPPP